MVLSAVVRPSIPRPEVGFHTVDGESEFSEQLGDRCMFSERTKAVEGKSI
jgi:hypothetical protein